MKTQIDFSKINVLLVDDTAPNLTQLKSYLQVIGFEASRIETADNGDNALKKLSELKKVDLVITDCMMPGINGFDLTGKIVRESNIPVIMTSSTEKEKTVMKAIEHGARAFIPKPYNARNISKVLTKIFEDPERTSFKKE